MFVTEFRYAWFHTYIHFLLIKTGQCATEEIKRRCVPAKLKDKN